MLDSIFGSAPKSTVKKFAVVLKGKTLKKYATKASAVNYCSTIGMGAVVKTKKKGRWVTVFKTSGSVRTTNRSRAKKKSTTGRKKKTYRK